MPPAWPQPVQDVTKALSRWTTCLRMIDQEEPSRPFAPHVAVRQRMMRICAEATESELEQALAELGPLPHARELRAPEQGLVMLRGRIGGGGRPFNLGESTVTRAVVALQGGAQGYAYLLGRCPRRARLAATVDALAQDVSYIARLEKVLVEPVEARRSSEQARANKEIAATRVNFFTVARGED